MIKYYLTIDTSEFCSVGIAKEENGKIETICHVVDEDTRHHAENIAPFVKKALEEAQIKKPDCVVVFPLLSLEIKILDFIWVS